MHPLYDQCQDQIKATIAVNLIAQKTDVSTPRSERAYTLPGIPLPVLGVLLGEQPEAAETSGISARTLVGGAILDHILGGRRQRVEDAVSRASGLTTAQTMKLMSILAPLMMGALGKRRQEGNLSPEGLGEMLRRERKDVDSGTFGGGVISRLLDIDGDGDFDFMDIMKFGASRIFGRR